MMSLASIISSSIENKLNHINTISLCEVISNNPLAIKAIYVQKHIDDDNKKRTIIQQPYNMDKKIYQVGDIVVVAFLQEVTEDGAVRKFDIFDAVVLGQAEKA